MENINNKISATATIENKVIRPRLIIQALAFTGILYFCVGNRPPDTARSIFHPIGTSTTLSAAVGNSVLQHTSQQSGLPPSALRIVQARPQTWSDDCLGLIDSRGSCSQMQVPGWQVAVVSGQQRWIYRTNASGSMIKLESNTGLPSL